MIFGVPDKGFFEALKAKLVFVAELRPGLEGAKTVAKELLKRKITPVVICDNMLAFCMRQGLVNDTHIFYKTMAKHEAVCRTGSLIAALCAKAHGIPVYLHKTGAKKERSSDLRKIGGRRVTGASIKTYVPACDRVPLHLIERQNINE